MITLEEKDVWLITLVGNQIQTAQLELGRLLGAQTALIKMLEDKYDAAFNPETKQLEPKKQEKETKE